VLQHKDNGPPENALKARSSWHYCSLSTPRPYNTPLYLSTDPSKVHPKLPESGCRQKAIRASLVLRPYPLHFQDLSQSVWPPWRLSAELHEVLDVVDR